MTGMFLCGEQKELKLSAHVFQLMKSRVKVKAIKTSKKCSTDLVRHPDYQISDTPSAIFFGIYKQGYNSYLLMSDVDFNIFKMKLPVSTRRYHFILNHIFPGFLYSMN